MDRQTYLDTANAVVRLVACALNGDAPDADFVAGLDPDAILSVSSAHMLTAAAAAALERAGRAEPALHEQYCRAIRDATLREAELSRVSAGLEARGIWYMPLKGAVLCKLYPVFGIRQMSDVDILVDPARAADVRDMMTALGYETESFGKPVHDVYKKPPIYHYEMHKELITRERGNIFVEYYKDVADRLLPDGGVRRRFSPEDFYVFLIVHAYKHFARGGTGLRTLADVYIYMKHFADALDLGYIRAECEKLGIVGFDEKCRRTALALFKGGGLSDEDRAFYEYFVFSGTYGTIANSVKHSLDAREGKHAKLAYLRDRLFLPAESVRLAYPFFYRHRALMPALFVYRLARSATVSRKRVSAEMKQVAHYNNRKKNTDNEKTE